MDLATIIGVILGAGMILYGLATSGAPMFVYWSPGSIAVTVGGAIASTVISIKLKDLGILGKSVKIAIQEKRQSATELIRTLVRFGEIARRDGILALEGALEDVNDDFLVRGIQMAVDGSDPELIYQTMSTELQYLEQRHGDGRRIWDLLAKYAPAFGMIGTLIGLVALLFKLDDPNAIGPAMSLALITTLYGAIVANYICAPISDKLSTRNQEELLLKEIIIQGVMSIQSGDNPKIVEQKLKIFLPPSERELGKEAA